MVRIADSAKISIGNQEVKGDTFQAAQLVWMALHERIRDNPDKYRAQPYEYNGRAGYQISVTITSVIRSLWPEYYQQDDETQAEFKELARNIRGDLAGRGNLKTLIRGGGGKSGDAATPSVYWVSSTYESEIPKTWVKVTSHETGEDMAPSEVTTTYKCRFCDKRYAHKPSLNRHFHQYHSSVKSPEQNSQEAVKETATFNDPIAALQFILDDYRATKERLAAIEKLLRKG